MSVSSRRTPRARSATLLIMSPERFVANCLTSRSLIGSWLVTSLIGDRPRTPSCERSGWGSSGLVAPQQLESDVAIENWVVRAHDCPHPPEPIGTPVSYLTTASPAPPDGRFPAHRMAILPTLAGTRAPAGGAWAVPRTRTTSRNRDGATASASKARVCVPRRTPALFSQPAVQQTLGRDATVRGALGTVDAVCSHRRMPTCTQLSVPARGAS